MIWAALMPMPGIDGTALNPMSLIPSSTMMSRTPGWSRASRPNRASALAPQHRAPVSTRLPPIPSSATASVGPSSASSLRARSLGQRTSAPVVELTPSVIESPNATTVPSAPGDRTMRPLT